MTIKNNLQIILITYNRKDKLENTFKQIFAKNSPIRDFDITILDNCSTDGTSELCKQYPNVKHIRHDKNIGGNANIVRAYEMATKKYVWVLCDDDKFDFSNFKEIEQAIKNDYDVILASTYAIKDRNNLSQLVRQLTFVPAGIYKTKLITSTVLMNMYFNLSNMFPHLAVVCKAINSDCSFYIPKSGVVEVYMQEGEYSYIRGSDENCFAHPSMKHMFWQVGFINSMQMIKDNKKRKYLIKRADFNQKTFEDISTFSMLRNILYARKHKRDNLKNICDVFAALPFLYKLLFLVLIFDYYCISPIFVVRFKKHKISFCFFTKFKTSIRLKPKKRKKQ